MLLMQKSRDSSVHANDNTKRDKLKLCLHMLTLQGIYMFRERIIYIIFIRERKG